MARIFLFSIAMLACFSWVSGQENKTTKKGERKGSWIIFYQSNKPSTDLLGEALSIEKIAVNDNETSALDKATYIESVTYKNGLKNGEFQFYSARKDDRGNYPLIASGRYQDGELSGPVSYYKNHWSRGPELIFTVQYASGKVIDQVVTFNVTPMIFTQKKGPQNEKEVKPFFRVENEVCTEQISTGMSGTRLVWVTRVNDRINQFTYFSSGKELMPSYYTDGSSCFDFAEKKIEAGTGKWIHDGRYLVCHDTGIPFDTSSIYMESRTMNGLLEGNCRYYDRDDELLIEVNYRRGDLDGSAVIYNPKLKLPIVEATYKAGFLHGKYSTYYTNEGKDISLISPNCVGQHRHIWSEDFFLSNATKKIMGEMIPLFRGKGYTVVTSDYFKLYEAVYEDGKVDLIEYYHADGSLLYREVGSECDKSNDSAASIEDLAARLTGPIQDRRGVWAWFDADGAMIYSSEMERDLREEAEKTKVCKSCGKFVPTETAVFRFGDYKCYDEFGEPMGIFSMSPAYFCSVQCKMAHEEDKCLSNGYRYKRP
jgi:antitoxin component YwqK of YwqJK toxin-antitoxin module